MSECLGKLVQRQAAVEICPLSVLQPELPSDLCPTLRSGQHVANNKKKWQGGGGGLLDKTVSLQLCSLFWPVSTAQAGLHNYNSLAR